MTKHIEEIMGEFRSKKELAKQKLKALAVKNGTVVDAEVITEDWLKDTLTSLSIKIHTDAIKELEGRIGKNRAWGDAIELAYDECVRDTITYHEKEIIKVK